jgi:hypothetical protein
MIRLNGSVPGEAQPPSCPSDYICPLVDICIIDYDPCAFIDICGIDYH